MDADFSHVNLEYRNYLSGMHLAKETYVLGMVFSD